MRALLSVALIVVLGGCDEDRTAIMLVVESDLEPGVDMDRIEITMSDRGAELWSDRHAIAAGAGLPVSYRLTPVAEQLETVDLGVAAVLSGRRVIGAERAVSFARDRSVEVRFCLMSACIGSGSDACAEGLCGASADGDGDADRDTGSGDAEVDGDRGPDVSNDAETDGADGDGDADTDPDRDIDARTEAGWTEVRPASSPSPRSWHAMAYDSARDRVVLFSGAEFESSPADTWAYDGTSWTEVVPARSPPGRHGHAMAYDSARDRVVLFGGNMLADTWEYDGSTWAEVVPAVSPPGRSFHAMAYDSARQVVVLFGGIRLGDALADTWEYDGVGWTEVLCARSPPARSEHAMAYDSGRSVVVLFGGDMLGDTWEYDEGSWTELAPASAPPARKGHAMAYDSRRGVVVLFAGAADAGEYYDLLGDTWEYDDAGWTAATPLVSPDARYGGAMAYDSAVGLVVLFGGLGPGILADTWEYGP